MNTTARRSAACPGCTGPLPATATTVCPACTARFLPPGGTKLSVLVQRAPERMDPASSLALPPEFAARYELSEILGAGTTGMVVRAVVRATAEPVAIKFLAKSSAPEALARFLREGEVMRRIVHPNVMRVLEVSEVQRHPFLVVELLEGGTLRARLDAMGRLPPAEAVHIAAGCLEGLHACHEAAVVHRDVKPENILFDLAGAPKLADLGLAKIWGAEERMTQTGAVLGTPKYMSPELARGDPAGASSDIYSLGLVLYEMLAGRAPYEAASLYDYLRLHADAEPPDLAEQVPSASPGLVRLVRAMLAKRVSDRPSHARDLAEQLRRADRVVVARPKAPAAAAAPAPGTPATPRPRVDGRAIAAIAAALAIGLTVAAVSRHRTHPLRTNHSSVAVPPVPVASGTANAVTAVDPEVAEFQEFWRTVITENQKTEERVKEQSADIQQEIAKGGDQVALARKLLRIGLDAEEEVLERGRRFDPQSPRMKELLARFVRMHSRTAATIRRVIDHAERGEVEAFQREFAEMQRANEWPETKSFGGMLDEMRTGKRK